MAREATNTEKANIREVYSLVDSVKTDMNNKFESLERKMDALALTYALQKDVVELFKKYDAQQHQLAMLNNWRWYVIGVVGAAIVFVQLLWQSVSDWFLHHK